MKGKVVLLATVLVTLTVTSFSRAADHRQLVHGFGALDRAYIPALALTNQGQAAPSKKAIAGLKKQWKVFAETCEAAMPDDPQWKPDLKRVGQIITKADQQIAAGELAEAHETLEEIRDIFLQLRRRNEIVYYLDWLTDFHETMEEIVKPAAAKVKQGKLDVSEADGARMRRLLAEATRQWQVVQSAEFDPEPLGYGPSKVAAMPGMIEAEANALAALEKALDGGDAERILQAAVAIKPPFAKFFMSFGDFPKPPQP